MRASFFGCLDQYPPQLIYIHWRSEQDCLKRVGGIGDDRGDDPERPIIESQIGNGISLTYIRCLRHFRLILSASAANGDSGYIPGPIVTGYCSSGEEKRATRDVSPMTMVVVPISISPGA